MKLTTRNHPSFKFPIYLIISICWFDTFLLKCTLAKPNKKIFFNSKPVSIENKENHLDSSTPSETWEPRQNNLNSYTEKFYQYKNILIEEYLSDPRKYGRATFLPQLTPVNNDDSWENYGDCKVDLIIYTYIRMYSMILGCQ